MDPLEVHSHDGADPDFRNFNLSRNMRYYIYCVKLFNCTNLCNRIGNIHTKQIMDKIDHANRCLDRDFNIKELVLHMKKNTELFKKNEEMIKKNTSHLQKNTGHLIKNSMGDVMR